MKILLCLIILLPILTQAQPFLGMALSTNSAEMHAGYAFNGLEVTAAYKAPYFNNEIARVASLTFSQSLHFADSLHYVRGGAGIATYNGELAPNFRAEVGRRYNQGTLFLLFDYCKNLFIMAGIKIYIK